MEHRHDQLGCQQAYCFGGEFHECRGREYNQPVHHFCCAQLVRSQPRDQARTGSTRNVQAFTINNAASASLQGVQTHDGGISVTAIAIALNANLTTDALVNSCSVALNGAVSLAANISIDSDNTGTDGSISFGGTLNDDGSGGSDRTLTFTAGTGNVTFTGIVGGTQDPNTINGAGIVTSSADLGVANALSITATTININGGISGAATGFNLNGTHTQTGGILSTADITVGTSGNGLFSSGTQNVSDDVGNSGTLSFAGTGTTVFNGTGTTQTITSGATFNNFTVNGSGNTVQVPANLNVNTAITVQSGTLSQVAAANTITGDGSTTFSMTGGTTRLLTSFGSFLPSVTLPASLGGTVDWLSPGTLTLDSAITRAFSSNM